MSESTDHVPIATQAALESAARRLADAELVAVDTEFVRERTYYPQLCLIQLATPALITAIDCLAPLDLSPLFAELLRPGCVWLLHSARQDLEVIYQRCAQLPERLIDSQIAAGLVGFAPQIGLETLLARALDVSLGESMARADWSRRPLPAAALNYAIDDVRYLEPAWRKLRERLADLGRLDWLAEDCARLLAERPVADLIAVLRRMRAVASLSPAAQRAALALVTWREQVAQRANRPRRWIVADDVLVAVAAALPETATQLAALVPERLAARHSEEILAAIRNRDAGPLEMLAAADDALRQPDRQRLNALKETVRLRAVELAIEPEILATRRDLAAVATGVRPPHLATGWRAAALPF